MLSGSAGRVMSRGGLRRDLREMDMLGSWPGAERANGLDMGVGMRGRMYCKFLSNVRIINLFDMKDLEKNVQEGEGEMSWGPRCGLERA